MNLLASVDFRDVIAANIWILVPAMVFAWLTVATIVENIRKAIQTKAIEESRREIAAYVAEGSMTPEDAERILAAVKGKKWGGRGERARACCA